MIMGFINMNKMFAVANFKTSIWRALGSVLLFYKIERYHKKQQYGFLYEIKMICI